MSIRKATCGYAYPGTYGHQCDRPAFFAGCRPSEHTSNGVYWAARCAECKGLTGRDNQGIATWEPLDPQKHVNEWK